VIVFAVGCGSWSLVQEEKIRAVIESPSSDLIMSLSVLRIWMMQNKKDDIPPQSRNYNKSITATYRTVLFIYFVKKGREWIQKMY
jgi:hypothetical protein